MGVIMTFNREFRIHCQGNLYGHSICDLWAYFKQKCALNPIGNSLCVSLAMKCTRQQCLSSEGNDSA